MDVGEFGIDELLDDDFFLGFFEGSFGKGVGAELFDRVVELFLANDGGVGYETLVVISGSAL